MFTGWKCADQIAHRGIHIWLVKRDPEIAEILEMRDHILNVAQEIANIRRISKASPVGEPERLGKMMQSHHRQYMPLPQIAQHRAVAIDRGAIQAALFRFDTAPFQAQAQRVVLHLLGPLKISFGSLPPIGSISAAIARKNMPLLLPTVPLIIGIAALALVSSIGSAPEKVLRETEDTFAGHRERTPPISCRDNIVIVARNLPVTKGPAIRKRQINRVRMLRNKLGDRFVTQHAHPVWKEGILSARAARGRRAPRGAHSRRSLLAAGRARTHRVTRRN